MRHHVRMQMRTFWLNLRLARRARGDLRRAADARRLLAPETTSTSLTMWLIPILYLWPTFAMTHSGNGTGRRRRALLATVALYRRPRLSCSIS